MINQVLIATTSSAAEEDAKNAIDNRSLLYNKDKKKLFVKYDNNLNAIGANPDNKNIIEDKNGNIALKDIPNVHGINIIQSGSDNWRGQRLLGNMSAAKNIILFFPKGEDGYIGGELLQKGTGITGHYEASLTNTGSRSFKGACTDDKKANLIACTYHNKTWYGMRFYSTVSFKLFFSGWYTKNPVIVGGSDVSEVVDLNDNADTGTVIVNGGGGKWDYEFDVFRKDLSTLKNHQNIELDERGKILTSVPTKQDDKATFIKDGKVLNLGCFVVQGNTSKESPIFQFTTQKKATVYVTFTALSSSSVNLYIEKIGSGITTASMNDQDFTTLDWVIEENKGPFYVWADGPVKIWSVTWLESKSIDNIIDEIDKLPETGPNGSPHIVRISTDLYKADLIKIAESCQNSNTQMIIDLSESICKGDGRNWGADKNDHARCLDSLFSGCRSLRKFAFPKGVTHAGGFTFQNCPFLDKIVLQDDIKMFGIATWTDVNTGFVQGTGVPKLWLSKDYGSFKSQFEGFAWAGSEVFDVYWPPESWLKYNWNRNEQFTNLFLWSYFAYADDRLRFHMPCHKLANGNWNLNDGELYSISQRLGNHQVTDGAMTLPSNKYAFKPKMFKDMCLPYDINDYDKMRSLDDKLY